MIINGSHVTFKILITTHLRERKLGSKPEHGETCCTAENPYCFIIYTYKKQFIQGQGKFFLNNVAPIKYT
jgi:hypothetical protein